MTTFIRNKMKLRDLIFILLVSFGGSSLYGQQGGASGDMSDFVQINRKVTRQGSDFLIEITITNDQQISGIARLNEEIPIGASASVVSAESASFAGSEGKVKFLWMSYPSKPSVVISYKLSGAGKAKESAPVKGAFSFLSENETYRKEVPVVDLSTVK